jgi:hypothetical protein
VVTAAHCLKGYAVDIWSITVGEQNRGLTEPHEKTISAEDVKIHDGFEVKMRAGAPSLCRVPFFYCFIGEGGASFLRSGFSSNGFFIKWEAFHRMHTISSNFQNCKQNFCNTSTSKVINSMKSRFNEKLL